MDNSDHRFPEESVIENKDRYTKDEIDMIPVYYCNNCLSLHVLRYDISGIPVFCSDCSSTDINTDTVEVWSRVYKERYGYKLLDKKNK